MLFNVLMIDFHLDEDCVGFWIITQRVVVILDVHGSVHHNINLIEITNKMRPCSRIYYFGVS